MFKHDLEFVLSGRKVALVTVLLGAISAAQFVSAEVIFEEDFDDQPDWTSTMHTTKNQQTVDAGDVIPEGWYGIYQGTQWSPETGYPDNHASLEILAKNQDKAKGGEGKSAVNWRESYSKGWKNWASDSQLTKVFDKQYKQIYVEFEVRFSPNFYGRNEASPYMSKLFRAGSWSGEGGVFSGYEGNVGPLMIWDYKRDDYGVRNNIAFRGGPHGENYYMQDEYPRFASLNYGAHTAGQGEGGSDPQLTDLIGGGNLIDYSGTIAHDQVFGPSEKWTKIAFFLKINSSPGATDGVLRQWVNGVQIVNREDIPWVQENVENKMVGWNYIAIGGNDYFQAYPNEEQFEDWYAIDNILVATSPLDAGKNEAESDNPPRPPENILIE